MPKQWRYPRLLAEKDKFIKGFSASEERMLEYYDVTASSASDRLIDGSMSSEEDDGEILGPIL